MFVDHSRTHFNFYFLDASFKTGMVTSIYPYNPEPVHTRLQEFFDKIEELKDQDQLAVIQILTDVAERNAKVSRPMIIAKITYLVCVTFNDTYFSNSLRSMAQSQMMCMRSQH